MSITNRDTTGDELIAEVRAMQSQPQKPLSEIDPRYRFGTWMRRRRVEREVSLRALAEHLNVSTVFIGQIERGLAPANAAHVADILAFLGAGSQVTPDDVLQYASDFSRALFWASAENPIQLVDQKAIETGAIPKHIFEMPPEVRYVEFREGWLAGASGRRRPDDMGDEWLNGFDAGRESYLKAMDTRRAELGVTYEDDTSEG